MINHNTVAIYYQAGAYGTFIEWCLNYFTDESFNEELPFSKNGSAHKFIGNPVFSEKMYQDLIDSSDCPQFVRFHPGVTSVENATLLKSPDSGPYTCYKNEIEKISSATKKTVVLYYNMESILWGCSNSITKTSAESMNDFKTIEELSTFRKKNNITGKLFKQTNFNDVVLESLDDNETHAERWNTKSIHNMDHWELREFLSMYLNNSWMNTNSQDLFNRLKKEFTNTIFIEISQLRDNFKESIEHIITQIDMIMVRKDKVNYIFNNWIKLQKYAHRDKLIHEIVDKTIIGEDFSWSDTQLSIYDEAIIQKLFRDKGYEIKCFKLNKFPISVKELQPLIYAT
jgi:hypothetical protein